MSLDNGAIFILGKKFNTNNQYERSSSELTTHIGKSSDMYESYIDANKMISLNESYICPSIPINRPSHDAFNNDFVSLASSPPLSTSPFANFKSEPQTRTANGNNGNKATAAYMADYLQLQYLTPQKTSLEQEIHSRLWFTYRKDFVPLNGILKYSSDCGWGCMLRSAQMLIGQGLLVHYFGKNWSLYNKFTRSEYNIYKEILALFNDRPSKSCPFGIHRLLQVADKKLIGNGNLEFVNGSSAKSTASNQENLSRVGSWFGPTSVCLLMKEALTEATDNPILNQIGIYVAQDCTIYKKDVINMCVNVKSNGAKQGAEFGPSFRPCIILISVRLGGDELNDIYIPSLKMFLEMETCIGVIGGKPRHSLYFFGYQGDKIVYLDPHFCQTTQNIYSANDQSIQSTSSQSSLSSSKHSYDDTTMSDYEIFDNSSFHCENPSKTPFTKLDPSLAIGFFCSSLDELNSLCDLAKNISLMDNVFPLFGVNDDSFESSQLKYQLLCDEEVLADSLANASMSSSNHKSPTSSAIPINVQSHNTRKNYESSKSSSSSSFKSSFMQSLPKKLGSSPNKKSFLAEKFTRSKLNKKKSETEDFVLL